MSHKQPQTTSTYYLSKGVSCGMRELDEMVDGFNAAIIHSPARKIRANPLDAREFLQYKQIPLADLRGIRAQNPGRGLSWCAGYWLGVDRAIDAISKQLMGLNPAL